MKVRDKKFEAAVHIGLLVIVFVLLFLNFRSNIVIFRDLSTRRVANTVKLNNSALSISRTIQKEGLTELTESQAKVFRKRHELDGVRLISAEGPLGQLSEVLATLGIKPADFDEKTLIKSDAGQYCYVHPVQIESGRKLLVMYKNIPALAYLDDASHTLIAVNLVAVLVIVGLYLLLFRFILSPFKKIKMRAIEAGRILGRGDAEVDGMVDEYQNIIRELQEKEHQLIELNRSTKERADSLEHFNDYLLESMSSGLVMVDRNGQILSINKAASQIVNLTADDYTGQSHADLPGFTSQIEASIDAILADRTAKTYFEIEFETDDSQIITGGINVSTIHDDDLQIVGASILINDLTEIRTLRNEAEARYRLAALG